MEPEYAYAKYCSIQKCGICSRYCEDLKNIVIISHRQYCRSCMDQLWECLDKRTRYRLLDHFVQSQKKIIF